MPRFSYIAQRSDGSAETGQLEAADHAAATDELSKRGLLVLSAEQQGSSSVAHELLGRNDVRPADLIAFTRELSMLLRGGVPILLALGLLGRKSPNIRLRGAIAELARDVSGGSALHAALARHPEVFPLLLVAMTEAGEISGALTDVLGQFATGMARQEEMRRRIRSVMVYPTLVLIVAAAVITFLSLRVIPTFAVIFKSMNLTLPLLTRVVITGCGWFKDHFAVAAAASISSYLLIDYFLETPPGVDLLCRIKRGVPVVRDIYEHAWLEQFFGTAAMLLRNGVSLTKALLILEKIFAEDRVIRTAIDGIANLVVNGRSLGSAIRASGAFPEDVVYSVEISEEVGEVPRSFDNLAASHHEQLEVMTRDIGTLIEPVLILVVGGVIAVVMLSLFLPMLELSSMRPF